MTSAREAAWIAAARRGDLEAFNRLVLAYQDAVYTHACYLLHDPDLAADITQDTFLTAWRKLDQYRGGSWRAWLMRIATNACLDELRRQKRRPTQALEATDASGEPLESASWLRDTAPGPEALVEQAELRAAIEHCLDELTPDFRAVVLLVDVQGFSYAEAAAAIRRPVGTVRSRLARARLQLQDCLQGFAELLPAAFRQEGRP